MPRSKGHGPNHRRIGLAAFVKLDPSDVHLNVEARLTELVGIAGKRPHRPQPTN